MGGYHNFMGSYSSYGFLAGISLVAVICGVIVVMSAINLRLNPQQRTIWAIVIIVFSVVSFVGMGGFFIGAILGIIGGAFVLFIRQTNP
jgi:bacteriorhodopsin